MPLKRILICALATVLLSASTGLAGGAAVEIVLDVSAPMTDDPAHPLGRVVGALERTLDASHRTDLEIAVRVYGSKTDPGGTDCQASELALPFQHPAAISSAVAQVADRASGRRVAPLAHALGQAANDLRARKASSRHIIVVAAAPDGCGADICAAAAGLREAGIGIEMVLLMSSSRAHARELACLGHVTATREPREIDRLLTDTLLDIGATTGVRVVRFAGADRAEPVRFSVEPVVSKPRHGLVATSPKAVTALPPGTYRLRFDDGTAPDRIIEVEEGEVVDIIDGSGSLMVRAENYYGAGIDATYQVRPNDVVEPAESSSRVANPRTRRRRVPHTTLPVQPPKDAPASQPATRGAAHGRHGQQPASQPSTRPGPASHHQDCRCASCRDAGGDREPHSGCKHPDCDHAECTGTGCKHPKCDHAECSGAGCKHPKCEHHGRQPATKPAHHDHHHAATQPATKPAHHDHHHAATQPATKPAHHGHHAATQPATRPAHRGHQHPATQPHSRAAHSRPATHPVTEITSSSPPPPTSTATGTARELPAGSYDVVIRLGKGSMTMRDVRITPGETTDLTVQFGAIRLDYMRSPLRIYDRDGRMLATARPHQAVHLPPGTYTVKDGSTTVRTVRVKPGDMELIER